MNLADLPPLFPINRGDYVLAAQLNHERLNQPQATKKQKRKNWQEEIMRLAAEIREEQQ